MRKRQNDEWKVRNCRRFFFGMSYDVPTFKILVLAYDFEILIGVNEY